MTAKATLRILFDSLDDAGQSAAENLDTDRLTGGLVLSGYTDKSVTDLLLGASTVDQAFAFTDALCLIIISQDQPFKMRLAAGERQLDNLRAYVVWADDTADGADVTSVLLSGNTVTPSQLKIYKIEKPA